MCDLVETLLESKWTNIIMTLLVIVSNRQPHFLNKDIMKHRMWIPINPKHGGRITGNEFYRNFYSRDPDDLVKLGHALITGALKISSGEAKEVCIYTPLGRRKKGNMTGTIQVAYRVKPKTN